MTVMILLWPPTYWSTVTPPSDGSPLESILNDPMMPFGKLWL